MDIVNEYHYLPNNSARNLKAARTNTVGLLVKGIGNPFFQRMTLEIERGLAMRGYSIAIQDVATKNEMETAFQEVRDQNLCGVILMGGFSTYTKEDFERLGVPCTLLTIRAAVDVDPALYSSVTIDDEQEGFKAIEALIQMGHRRIGFLYYHPLQENTPNTARYRGYLRALNTYGIPYDPNLVAGINEAAATISSEGGYRTGFRMAQQLLQKCPDITAMFSFSDIIAIGAAKAVLTSGRSIPGDISILGFDGIEAAEFFHPSLDTIYQPSTEMAMSSISLLTDMLQGRAGQHILCQCTLLRRGSTRSIP